MGTSHVQSDEGIAVAGETGVHTLRQVDGCTVIQVRVCAPEPPPEVVYVSALNESEWSL